MRDTLGALGANLMIFADTSDAIKTVREWVIPTVQSIASLASIAAVLILTYAGYIYMTSTGNPKRIELAKNIAKKGSNWTRNYTFCNNARLSHFECLQRTTEPGRCGNAEIAGYQTKECE